MTLFNFWLAFAIIFVLIGIGILALKRNENSSIKEIAKKYAKDITALIIIFFLIYFYKYHIPFNKNHGKEFNSEREKLGIPRIGENWENRKYESDQFSTYWWKPEPRNGHFKKVTEYGILSAKTETDYYQNENLKGTFAWSKYDFQSKTFEYFLEKPNEEIISVTDKGNLKLEKPTKILNIDKTEFEKYIKE